MGCFSSKQSNGRVFDDISDISLPALISQLHANTSTLLQLSNECSHELKIIKGSTEDDQGKIWLHQGCELQLTPIEGKKKFVHERKGITQEFVAKEGDALFVMPFGTMPDVVLIEEGGELSISKIRTLLELVTIRLTGIERYRLLRSRRLPLSMVSTGWLPEHELPPT